MSHCVVVLNHIGKAIHERTYRGENAIEDFSNHLFELYDVLDAITRIDIPMIYTEENKTSFEKSTHCWVCEDPFLIESYNQFTSLSNTKTRDLYKVRHHCHLTGEYIGACHSL